MKNITSFAAGVMAAGIVMAGTFAVGAAAREQNIKAEFADIKIVMDGTAITPKDANGNTVEPFIWNGTTYLPVRAVGSAIGKEVSWDSNTKTVYLGKKPDASANYSRSNPAPIGKGQTITVSKYSETYTASVVVLDSVRGAEALQKMQAANPFNPTPEAGMEYVVAKIRASVGSSKDDKAVDFSEHSFTAYSSDNVEYKDYIMVSPQPEFRGKVYKDGTLEGYVAFIVKTTDKTPKIVFGEKYDGTGGIWFSLTK